MKGKTQRIRRWTQIDADERQNVGAVPPYKGTTGQAPVPAPSDECRYVGAIPPGRPPFDPQMTQMKE